MKANPIQTQYSKFSILNSKFCILSLCLRCVVEGAKPISLDFLVKKVYVYFRTAIHLSRVPNKMNSSTENERFRFWQGRRSRLLFCIVDGA